MVDLSTPRSLSYCQKVLSPRLRRGVLVAGHVGTGMDKADVCRPLEGLPPARIDGAKGTGVNVDTSERDGSERTYQRKGRE